MFATLDCTLEGSLEHIKVGGFPVGQSGIAIVAAEQRVQRGCQACVGHALQSLAREDP